MKAAMRRTSPVAEGTSPLQHRCSVRIGYRRMRKCSALGAALIGVFAAILPANGEDAGIGAFIHSEARGEIVHTAFAGGSSDCDSHTRLLATSALHETCDCASARRRASASVEDGG